MSRATVCSPALFSLTFVLATGTAWPLAAQQRVEVVTRRTLRAESDSVERQMRRLRLRADSLTRIYGETVDAHERRRAGEALDQTVERLYQLESAMDMDVRVMRLEPPRGMMAPMANDRAVAAMAQALSQKRAPRGWLGIVVSGAAREPWVEKGELLVRYLTHPEIVSVEPSSPAERAGLVPSDTLIAYDGRDVTEGDISVTRLLRPNARVLVRIRRDGHTRDVPVKIADAPRRIVIRVDEMMTGGAPSALAEGPVFPRSPAPPALPMMPGVPRRTSVGAFGPTGPIGFDGPQSAVVAGAQLNTVTPGLARSIRVNRGVIVASAPFGSPAAESGLMDGDVIVKVAGEEVRTAADVAELVGAAVARGEHSVPLQTLRERKPRKAVLRW
jgi:serine protease Do